MGSKLRIVRKGLLGAGLGIGALYAWDQTFNRRALSRTGYAIYNATLLGIDYELNFREGCDIDALHLRNANRLYNVIVQNAGLYVKIGQSIAVQGNMLPLPYRTLLSRLFDDAPQDLWEDSLDTLRAGIGRDPAEVFSSISPKAVASASIAQVHKGVLRSTGEEVAIKIQHSDIPVSSFWDLNTYKAIMWVFDKLVFKMPMYFAATYITDQVRQETDFRIEKRNAETMRGLIEADPETRGKIYVPKMHADLCSERVLVMEWIEGASLSRKDQVEAAGYNVKQALTNVFKILTKEAFEWGVVHSDPHPGNWILRPNPRAPKQQQLVMIDHGLYVYMSETLRLQYGQLWRAIFRKDLPEITRITKEWGFGDAKLFASATMLQPYDDDMAAPNRNRDFQQQEKIAKRFQSFLKDSTRVPLSLIFVGRTQRILQNLNQLYGSPVNRMRILVEEALKLDVDQLRGDWRKPVLTRVVDWIYRRILIFVADLVFWTLQIRQLFTKEDPEAALEESIQSNSGALLK